MTMKQKIILMLLVLSGVLFSCRKTMIDYETTEEHIYNNQTEYHVLITGYSVDSKWDGTEWRINPSESLCIESRMPHKFTCDPSYCDSVLVTFDGKKKIMVRRGEHFFTDMKTEKVDKRWNRYYYYITDKLYNAAE